MSIDSKTTSSKGESDGISGFIKSKFANIGLPSKIGSNNMRVSEGLLT